MPPRTRSARRSCLQERKCPRLLRHRAPGSPPLSSLVHHGAAGKLDSEAAGTAQRHHRRRPSRQRGTIGGAERDFTHSGGCRRRLQRGPQPWRAAGVPEGIGGSWGGARGSAAGSGPPAGACLLVLVQSFFLFLSHQKLSECCDHDSLLVASAFGLHASLVPARALPAACRHTCCSQQRWWMALPPFWTRSASCPTAPSFSTLERCTSKPSGEASPCVLPP